MFNGRKVRELRQARDISTETLANKIGLSRGYLNLIETGKRTPGLECQMKIASCLGISLNALNNSSTKTEIPVEEMDDAPKEKNCRSEPEEVDTDTDVMFSVPMLFGIVAGVLKQYSISVQQDLVPSTKHQDLQGTISRENHCGIESFQLEHSTESVVLKISTFPIKELMNYSKIFCRLPDVIVSDTTPDGDISHEVVWFTEFSSTYRRVQQCAQWLRQREYVYIVDFHLQLYLEPSRMPDVRRAPENAV